MYACVISKTQWWLPLVLGQTSGVPGREPNPQSQAEELDRVMMTTLSVLTVGQIRCSAALRMLKSHAQALQRSSNPALKYYLLC